MVILGGLEIIIGGYIIHKVISRRRRRGEELEGMASSNSNISSSSNPVQPGHHHGTEPRVPNRKTSSNYPREPDVPVYSQTPPDPGRTGGPTSPQQKIRPSTPPPPYAP